jgi:LCP family protein required for cell wall assembly
LASAAGGIWQIATDPRAGFPGMSRVNILCMGIDDNWTDSDEVYTAGARTDTLFLMSLDLDNKKAYVLSIPRDSFVHIAGTDYSDKINAAYASGGPQRSEATIEENFGVRPDYYVVLRIDATKKMVDALGGVDVNVEHEMDYDDNWGHLHVHLTPGEQHLNGDQAVGFARYRHGNHGLTPEDGDPRRIYRQHVLLRAMMDKAKSFSNVLQANSLIDTAMSCVDTDMTRTQLFDLAAIFHDMPQDDLQTAQLDGTDFKGPHGASDTKLDDARAKLYIAWMIQGDENAARALTPVVVENGTKTPGIAEKAMEALRSDGYSDIRLRSAAQTLTPRTDIIDSGVPFKSSGQDIATLLGDTGATVVLKPVQPNHVGWTPPASVTVILGTDYASTVQTASGNLTGPSVSTTP